MEITLAHHGVSRRLYVSGDEPVTYNAVSGKATARATLDGIAVAEAADGGRAFAVYMSKDAVRRMINHRDDIARASAGASRITDCTSGNFADTSRYTCRPIMNACCATSTTRQFQQHRGRECPSELVSCHPSLSRV